MSDVDFFDIVQQPEYLTKFPLLGKKISEISQFLPTDDGKFKIGKPGAIPPFGKQLETSKEYALISDNGVSVNVRVISRDVNSAIVEPVSIRGADLLADIKIESISEVNRIKVLSPKSLCVEDRIRYELIQEKITALREDPDYSFSSKLMIAALNTEEAIARIEAAEDDNAKLEIQNEIIVAAFEARSSSEKISSARDERLSLEMLNLNRQQIEILGELPPNTLAKMPPASIQSIIAAINAPDDAEQESSDSTDSEEKPTQNRRKTAKKGSVPSES